MTAENKLFLKKTIILAISFFVLVLTITSFTVAWMSRNRTLNSTGIAIKAAYEGGANVFEYKIYKRSGDDAAQCVYDTTDPTNQTPVEMTEYDRVFTYRNVNTPVIIRAIINDVPESTTGLKLSVKCVEDNWLDDHNILQSKLSNIIGISGTTIRSLDNETDPVQIYTGVLGYISNTSNNITTYQFAHVNGTTNTSKTESFNITIPITSSSSYVVDGDRRIVFYLKLDYVSELANSLLDQHGFEITNAREGGTINDRLTIDFDLKPIFVSYDN